MVQRTAPPQHKVHSISDDLIEEIAYRVYLRRLEPMMTPEQSKATTRTDVNGKVTASDETRRKNSKSLIPLLREHLRILIDMDLWKG